MPDAQSNLLGLLKFAAPASPQITSHTAQAVESPRPTYTRQESHSNHGRGVSASDLVASLRGGSSKAASPSPQVARHSSSSHQDSLLKLLNQTTASSDDLNSPSMRKSVATPSLAGRESPPVRVFGSKEATPTPFEPQAASPAAKTGPVFTYVNPFEQLAASSPLKADTPDASNKRSRPNEPLSSGRISSPLPFSNQTKGLTQPGNEILKSIEIPPSDSERENRTQRESVLSIGAPSRNAETIQDALNIVGRKAHEQAKNALSTAEEEQSLEVTSKNEGYHAETSIPTLSTSEAASLPTKDEADPNAGDLGVVTYSIAMRPFSVIDVKKTDPGIPLREENIVNIARFKKDFDQVDRSLVTASKDFIVYGIAKSGGIRVIEQENGTSKIVFGGAQDRVFNVTISKSPKVTDLQCLLGTGVTGTVYWTMLSEDEQHDMEKEALIIPPMPAANESSSTGQLKTRVKTSSRSPNFLAIGRGKSIHIVFPFHARQSRFMKGRTLDTEGYFADRSLKVTPGKAGKDFVFSEDDTVIATLDKHGKVRLWDVRDLVHPDNGTASILAPIEIKTPVLSYSVGHSVEKVWPTSIQFVDKLKPYQKGIAQRYVLVGMKQNHILQLFDLTLDKVIQEIHFPHDNESDAICSVAFHPETSLIIVGHPTRNSIYVIQLSAPKYHLPSISQAKLIARLANRDPGLPKTESTAILNGFREYCLNEIGQLRSLSLTPPYGETPKPVDGESSLELFELYVMHSKGVTCLSFKKQDIGWSPAGKVLHSVDAIDAGIVDLQEFRNSPAPTNVNQSVNGDAATTTAQSKAALKAVAKDHDKAESKTSAVSANPPKTSEKKKAKQETVSGNVSKQAAASAKVPTSTASKTTTIPPTSSTKSVETPSSEKALEQHVKVETEGKEASITTASNGINVSNDFVEKGLQKVQQSVLTVFEKTLQQELAALHGRLDSDKRVSNATVHANQEAILRLVSQQLGDNVEKSLGNIVSAAIKTHIKPMISDATRNVLEKNLAHVLGQQLEHLLPLHLKPAINEAVKAGLSQGDLPRLVSDQVSMIVKQKIDRDVSDTLKKTIEPQFQRMTIGSMQLASQESEKRLVSQLQQVETLRREDSAKIEHLKDSVRGLSETISQMAEAQSAFHQEILRLRQGVVSDERATAPKGSPTPSESASVHVSLEQQEIDEVADAMQKGKYEDATIMVSPLTPTLANFCSFFEVASISTAADNPLRSYLHSLRSRLPTTMRTFGSTLGGSGRLRLLRE